MSRIEHKFTVDTPAGFTITALAGQPFNAATEAFYCGVLLDDVIDYTQTVTQITFVLPFKAGEDVSVVTPAVGGSNAGPTQFTVINNTETLQLTNLQETLNVSNVDETLVIQNNSETLQVIDNSETLQVSNVIDALEITNLVEQLVVTDAGVQGPPGGNITPGQVKTLYESNANTNAFTDAEQTKLAGIPNTFTQAASTVFAFLRGTDGDSLSITKFETGDTLDVPTLQAAGNILVEGLTTDDFTLINDIGRTLQRTG